MVVRWTKWNQRILRDERTIVEALPHLALVYEDDLLDGERHQPTLDRTFAHLGLPSHPVTAPLRRTGAGSLAERIANYEEIVAHIRTTPFATYLQD
jgi:hypothetical protein